MVKHREAGRGEHVKVFRFGSWNVTGGLGGIVSLASGRGSQAAGGGGGSGNQEWRLLSMGSLAGMDMGDREAGSEEAFSLFLRWK